MASQARFRLRIRLRQALASPIATAVIGPYLVQRIVLTLAMFCVTALETNRPPWRALADVPLLDNWIRWDSRYYLTIADTGYDADSKWSPNSFFPLFGWLIRAVGLVMPLPYAALLVSNAAALVAFGLLYSWVEEREGEQMAARTVRVAVLFPTSFFLTAAYAESTLTALVLGVLVAASRRKILVALLCAAAATLTRPVGAILVTVPFVADWVVRSRRRSEIPWFVLGAGLGTALLLLTYYVALRDPIAFAKAPQVRALRGFWDAGANSSFVATLLDEGWCANLMRRLLNWSAFGLALATLLRYLRQRPREVALAVFPICALVLPVALQRTILDAASMARYLLPAFPIYLAIAAWSRTGARAVYTDWFLLVFQVVLATQFALSRWVE